MLFLRLKRLVLEMGTMVPSHERNDNYVDYRLPIDLLGPFENSAKGTEITLRNNMGYIIVKESVEQIENLISELFMLAQGNN